jgi:hypothetical protein
MAKKTTVDRICSQRRNLVHVNRKYGYVRGRPLTQFGEGRGSQIVRLCRACPSRALGSASPNCSVFQMKIHIPWSKALLEKLVVAQPVNKFPAFYGTRRFITKFTRPYHWALPWNSWLQFTSSRCFFKTHFNIMLPCTSKSPRIVRNC